MIKILKYGEVANEDIFARVIPTANVEDIVSEIIANVRANGDKALFEYCEKFDKAKLTSLAVSEEELDEAMEPYVVSGPNIMTVHPVDAPVTYQEIAHCLDKSVAKIETSILSVLEQTPPELYGDIVKKGIFLTGGGALLRGLDQRLTKKINIPFHVAEDPLRAVARGTCIALKNPNLPFLMR